MNLRTPAYQPRLDTAEGVDSSARPEWTAPLAEPPKRGIKRRLAVGSILLVVAGGALALAYQLDKPAASHVARGVTLDGEPVGGLSGLEVDRRIEEVAMAFGSTPIQVERDRELVELTSAELGITVDRSATAASLMRSGRGTGAVSRFANWLSGFVVDRRAPIHLATPSEDRVNAGLDSGLGLVERWGAPTVTMRDGELVAVPGQAGLGLDGAHLVELLPPVMARLEAIPVTPTQTRPVDPPAASERLTELIAQLNAATVDGFEATFGQRTATIPATRIRQWIDVEIGDEGPLVSLDEPAALAHLRSVFGGEGRPGNDATVEIVDGEPTIVAPTDNGSRCCAPQTVDRIAAALQDGRSASYLVGVEAPSTKDAEWAEGLGIVEKVGTFTTKHAAGQTRVKNIHRIADMVRGVIIEPGGTFSVNDHIGRRTKANGFFSAGVIYEGKFTTDYGGGISQFATTLFNAAFFGGYDFGEYQSHSIYISRYPYGREATLSFPHPDLQIINNSPHGVMIWPTYTASTITIDLYSTPWAVGEQTDQSTGRYGPGCKSVTTERTRVFVEDGRTEVDTVEARYRPAEGVRC